MNTIRVLSLTLVLLVIPAMAVLAGPPALPSNFYGTVRLNGANAPTGAYVSARVKGVECGRSSITQDPDYGTVYTLNALSDDPETPEVDGGQVGDTVTFVLELPGGGECPMPQEGVWQSGLSAEVDLDFLQVAPALVLPLILNAG